MITKEFHIDKQLSKNKVVNTYQAREIESHQPIILQVLENKISQNVLPNSWNLEENLQLSHNGLLKFLKNSPSNDYHIYENFDGVLLYDYIKQNDISCKEFIKIATHILHAVVYLHKKQLIIKNICPKNILINQENKTIKLFNLINAVPLTNNEAQIFQETNICDSNYIAPELSGNLPHEADLRSDLYSLGVLFYNMLTKELPKSQNNVSENIQTEQIQLNKLIQKKGTDIPNIIFLIIEKLLEKDPKNRYQTADGLLFDLNICNNNIDKIEGLAISLDEFNKVSKLTIPNSLYGRENEVNLLEEKVKSIKKGHKEIVLISGKPGIGKSEIVNIFFQDHVDDNLLFLEGKFEQFQENIPYYAFRSAFGKFCTYILSKNTKELEQWRKKITQATGIYGQVLTDIIPELEQIIGPQNRLPEVSAHEAKKRFIHVFRDFVQTLCSKEMPVALFIDDCQWTDDASVELMNYLLTDTKIRNLLFIAAYRNNEVDENHPFMQSINEMIDMRFPIVRLDLELLQIENINELLGEAMGIHPAECRELAIVIHNKTLGNPFFAKTFIRTLYEEGIISYDSEQNNWSFDLKKANEKKITQNVVDLLSKRIDYLKDDVKHILKYAACIGNRFTKRTLQLITNFPNEKITPILEYACSENFIAPSYLPSTSKIAQNEHYKFIHDTVQQAFYDRIPEQEKKILHNEIGNLLLNALPEQEKNERLYEIVNHLNHGVKEDLSTNEKIIIIEQNLSATTKAMSELAYNIAFKYMNIFSFYLEDKEFYNFLWEMHYDLTVNLHKIKSQIEYLTCDFKYSQATVTKGIFYAKNNIDKASLYYILIVQHTLHSSYPEAISIARTALSLFNIELPENNFEEARNKELKNIYAFFNEHGIEHLHNLPTMESTEYKTIVKLLITMGPPCYRSHQHLWSVIVPKVVNIIIEQGLVPEIGYCFTALGGLVGWVHNDYSKTKILGDIAEQLMTERFRIPSEQSVFYLMEGSSVRHWVQPLTKATKDYEKAYKIGIDSGNLQYTAYACGHNMYCLFFQGLPLKSLKKKTGDYLSFSKERSNIWAIDLLTGGMLIINEFIQPSDLYNKKATEFVEGCTKNKNIQVICIFHIMQTFSFIVNNRLLEADKSFLEAEKRIHSVGTQGLLPWPEHIYNYSLLLIHKIDRLNKDHKEKMLATLYEQKKLIEIWATHNPEIYACKLSIINAELERIKGNYLDACTYFDQAIQEAQENHFVQHEAYANERCFIMWNNLTRYKLASPYLKQSMKLYKEWGAQSKILYLENINAQNKEYDTQNNDEIKNESIQISTIYKITQTLSEEINIKRLTRKLMSIVLEKAGAERAVLILNDHNTAYIFAEGTENNVHFAENTNLEQFNNIPHQIVNYVLHTFKTVAIKDKSQYGDFASDEYIENEKPKSIICIPLINQSKLIGVLYIENKLLKNSFNNQKLELLNLLSTHITISIDNALLYNRLEEVVAQRTEQLEASQLKLKRANNTKDKFFSIIAHDLRSPFTAILGVINVLIENYKDFDEEKMEYFLENMKSATSDTLHLLENLLKWAQAQEGDMKMYCNKENISSLIDNAMSVNTHSARRKEIALIKNSLPEIFVNVDRDMIRTVLHNLISNAIKFTERKGSVNIITFPNYEKNIVGISIVDSGVGMDEETLSNLFNAQHSLTKKIGTEAEKGTGIGLLLCKEFIEKHGGQLTVTSEIEQGSIFSFELPLADN